MPWVDRAKIDFGEHHVVDCVVVATALVCGVGVYCQGVGTRLPNWLERCFSRWLSLGARLGCSCKWKSCIVLMEL